MFNAENASMLSCSMLYRKYARKNSGHSQANTGMTTKLQISHNTKIPIKAKKLLNGCFSLLENSR